MLPNRKTRIAALGVIIFTLTIMGVAEAALTDAWLAVHL